MTNDLSITKLKGPDRIRKRPAVIFGSNRADGAAMAVKILLNIFISEAVLGYCKGIDLQIKADNSICVRSYDKGFMLDDTLIEGKPAWYQYFCEMYYSPRDFEEYNADLLSHRSEIYGKDDSPAPKYLAECDHFFDLCCLQYVSAFMHVEATRDGFKKTLDFEKGYSVSNLQKEQSDDSSNTYICFKLDSEVFEDVNFSISEIANFLKYAAIAIPGIQCSVSDERNGFKRTYFYPNGAEGYAKESSPYVALPLFINEIEATGKDRYNYREYDAKVRIVLGFTADSPSVTCLHNFRELEYGGSHLKAVETQLASCLNWEFSRDFADLQAHDDSLEFTFDKIKNNLVLVLETNCTRHFTKYENATKKAITNRMITDMARDLLSREFKDYLKQNREAILNLLKNIK